MKKTKSLITALLILALVFAMSTGLLAGESNGAADVTTVVNLAPSTMNLTATDSSSATVSLTDKSVVDDYHQYQFTGKAGKYTFSATDADSNNWGSVTITITESKTLTLRGSDFYCSTKVNDTYLTQDQYSISILEPATIKSTAGTVYTDDNGQAHHRYLMYAAGNEIVYNYLCEPANANMGISVGQKVNNTVAVATTQNSVNLTMPTAINGIFKVPHGASIKVSMQLINYVNKEITTFTKEDGLLNDTYTYALPKGNSSLTYRCSDTGKITRAGYLSTSADFTKDISFSDKAQSYRGDYTKDGGSGYTYLEDNLLLNISDSRELTLAKGDTFRIRSFRAWQIVDTATSNIMIEPDFHYEVVKGDAVSVNSKGVLTAEKNGVSVVEVTYDALDIDGSSIYNGIYNAIDPQRKGTFVVNVGADTTTEINTGIALTEFDTIYFDGAKGSYTFTPTAAQAITVKVNDVAQTPDEKGAYTVDIQNGSNIIEVSSGNSVKYHVVKGKRITVEVSNVTRPGFPLQQGDTVKISFQGLQMPVPKMAGIYNPGYMGTLRTAYDIKEGGNVAGKGTQYDFVNNNSISFEVWNSGTYSLTNGTIPLSSMGDVFGFHRQLDDSGKATNFSALERVGEFCTLPDVSFSVVAKEDVAYPTDLNTLSSIKLTHGTGMWTSDFSKTYAKTTTKPIAQNNAFSYTNYTASYPMTVTATPLIPDVSIKYYHSVGNGEKKEVSLQGYESNDLGTAIFDDSGINYIDVVVTPYNTGLGGAKSYSFLAYNSKKINNAGLSDLTVNCATEGVSFTEGKGVLLSDGAEGFFLSHKNYTLKVNNAVDSITLTPTKIVSSAIIKVNGNTVATKTASEPIPLTVGENVITVSTTNAQGEEAIDYTVTATRSATATLENLRVSGYTPSATNTLLQYTTDNYGEAPKFDKAVASYDLATQYDNYSSVYLRGVPTVSGSVITAKCGNATATLSASSSKSLAVTTGKNQIQITVTPPSGSDAEQSVYLLNLNVQPSLTRLPLEINKTTVVLDKTFDKTTTEYTANVLSTEKTLDIAGASTKSTSIVTVNGEAITHSGSITKSVNIESIDTIEIAVSGGSDANKLTTTYRIHLNKVAPSTLAIQPTPADADVKVFDPLGNPLTPQADGSYVGMFKENVYTYTVTKKGYIANKGNVPQENTVSLNITLEKATPENITFSAQKDNNYIVPRTETEVYPGLAEAYGYSYDKNVKPTDITTLDALVAAHINYFGNDFTAETATNYLNVDKNSGLIRKMFNISSTSLSFAVNGLYPHDGVLVGNSYTGYTVNQAVIQKGDVVEFFFYQDSYWSDNYTWFEKNGKKTEALTVDKGDALTLTLRGYAYGYYGYASDAMRESMTGAIANTQIGTINTENGNFTPLEGIVTGVEDSNKGQANITFDKKGTYVLSAKGDTSNYVISPWCVITVTDVVKDVEDIIFALPQKVTKEDKKAIAAARKSFDSLSEKKQNAVSKEAVAFLADKEAQLAQLDFPDAIGTVTISIEKFTLGQGYHTVPTIVPIYQGDHADQVLLRLLGEENYRSTGTVGSNFYLSAIKDNDTSPIAIPQFILDSTGAITEGRGEEGWLGEFDYYSMSGWMYSVNNEFPNVGSSAYVLKNGDVLRWQFTLYGYGEDVNQGANSSDKSLLTTEIAEFNKIQNKDLLLSKEENKNKYNSTLAVMFHMESTQQQVNDALNTFKEIDTSDKAFAEIAAEKINGLPSANSVTLENKAAIADLRSLVDSLTKEQQNLINKDSMQKLSDCEAAIKKLETPNPEPEPEKPKVDVADMKDVPADQWYYEDVSYVLAKGLMKGTSTSAFAPQENMTRGQFVTVLGRYAGIKDSSAETPKTTQFKDVDSNMYYASHIAWAYEHNIIKGMSADTFAPESSITREQMAVIMQNFAEAMKFTLTKTDSGKFADDDKISDWAKTEVYLMKDAGFIKGKENNIFDPQGKATRAEVSAILHRFIASAEK